VLSTFRPASVIDAREAVIRSHSDMPPKPAGSQRLRAIARADTLDMGLSLPGSRIGGARRHQARRGSAVAITRHPAPVS
jgi:hypothetical protein